MRPDRHHKPTGTEQNPDRPPETRSTSCLPYLTTNVPSMESPLTTLFPSHNPLGNNVNFISKIGLDSHCFSLSPLLSYAGPAHLHFSLCYFSRFRMSLPASTLRLYIPLSKSSHDQMIHFIIDFPSSDYFSFLPTRAPGYFSNTASMLLPQGLCTYYFLCLKVLSLPIHMSPSPSPPCLNTTLSSI